MDLALIMTTQDPLSWHVQTVQKMVLAPYPAESNSSCLTSTITMECASNRSFPTEKVTEENSFASQIQAPDMQAATPPRSTSDSRYAPTSSTEAFHSPAPVLMPILESPTLDTQFLISKDTELKPTAHVIPGTFRFATLLDTKEYQPRLISSKREDASKQQLELQQDLLDPPPPTSSSSASRTLAPYIFNTFPISESIFQEIVPPLPPRIEDRPYDPYQIRFPKNFSPKQPLKPSRVNPRWATPENDGIMPVDPYRIIYPPTFDLEGGRDLELAFDGKVGANPALHPVSGNPSTLDPFSVPLSRSISELSSQFEYPTINFASGFDLNRSLTPVQATEGINREADTPMPFALEAGLVDVAASAVTATKDEQVGIDEAADDVSTAVTG